MSSAVGTKGNRITTKQVQDAENKPFTLPEIQHKPEVDDDEPTDGDGLNMRRRAFVEHITSDSFGNATRSAELAGYASDNRKALEITACRLLGNARVQEAIRGRLAEVRMTAEWTRRAIADYARASMADFMRVEGGELVMDWDMAAAAGAIGHIREVREDLLPGQDGKRTDVVKRTFKIRDPMPALALLAKMNGLVNDAPAGASVTVNVHQMSEHDLVRIATRSGDGTTEKTPGAPVTDRLR